MGLPLCTRGTVLTFYGTVIYHVRYNNGEVTLFPRKTREVMLIQEMFCKTGETGDNDVNRSKVKDLKVHGDETVIAKIFHGSIDPRDLAI